MKSEAGRRGEGGIMVERHRCKGKEGQAANCLGWDTFMRRYSDTVESEPL